MLIKPEEKRERGSFAAEASDWIKTLCASYIFVALTFSFIGRAARVSGPSMEPTLAQNDMLIIRSLGLRPKPGDIVACSCYSLGKGIIKRVAAVGGQTVNIDFSAGKVYVDGEEFTVPGIDNLTLDRESNLEYPLTVPEGKLFVLGDNRQHSTDSRNSAVGLIDRSDVLGKAVLRFFPPARITKF